MRFLKDMFNFLKSTKKLWLFPVIFVMILFGGLIILSSGSVLAPFIYTLF